MFRGIDVTTSQEDRTLNRGCPRTPKVPRYWNVPPRRFGRDLYKRLRLAMPGGAHERPADPSRRTPSRCACSLAGCPLLPMDRVGPSDASDTKHTAAEASSRRPTTGCDYF